MKKTFELNEKSILSNWYLLTNEGQGDNFFFLFFSTSHHLSITTIETMLKGSQMIRPQIFYMKFFNFDPSPINGVAIIVILFTSFFYILIEHIW